MESMLGMASLEPAFGNVWTQLLIGIVVVAAVFFRRGLLSALFYFRRPRPDAEAGLGK